MSAKLDIKCLRPTNRRASATVRLVSRRVKARQWWVTLHRWIALSLGFLFVLLGLTGSVNVFHWELEEWGLPAPETRPSNEENLPLNVAATNLDREYPQLRDQGHWLLFMPGYERDYIWAIHLKPLKSGDEVFAPLRVQLNPSTGDIVAEHVWGQTPWTLIYSLHASLLSGEIWGRQIGIIGFKTVCFLGLFLLISAATGIYLWWPRTGKFLKALSFKRGASAIRFHFDLHRVVGFFGSGILIILAFTGFSFGWHDYLKPMVALVSPVQAMHFHDPEGLKSIPRPGAEPISIEHAVAVADRIFPDAELRWIATPDGPEGVYAVEKRQPGEANRRRPRSKIWLDQYSGEVLAIEDPKQFTAGETFFNLMWPLHNGEFLGLPSRILWCAAGFVPLVLYVTGITLWLRKRRARRYKRQPYPIS